MKVLKKWLVCAILFQMVTMSPLMSSDNNENNMIQVSYQSADGGNILFSGCNYRTPSPTLYVNVISVTGGSGNYTITPSPNTFVSHTSIKQGEGFTFYFSEAAQNSEEVCFKINGNQYNSCDFIPQLRFLDIGECAQPAFVCPEEVTHNLGTIAVTDYSATNTIHSSGKVQKSSTVNYYAASSIDLGDSFEVEPNANFFASIEVCP